MPKISELPALMSTPIDPDLLPLVDGGVTKKMTLLQLSEYLDLNTDNLKFVADWNANVNNPPLASGVGDTGAIYIVSVPGNTTLDGYTDWHLNDWAVFNGTIWQKVEANTFSPSISNIKYVSSLGNNTWDGSIKYPYAALSYAVGQSSTIVVLDSITDAVNQIFIKPNSTIIGLSPNCKVNVSLAVTIDPSFTSNVSTYIGNITIGGDLNLDLSSLTGSGSVGTITVDNVTSTGISTNGGTRFATINLFSNNSSGNIILRNNAHFSKNNTCAATLVVGQGIFNNTNLSFISQDDNTVNLSLRAPLALTFIPYFELRNTRITTTVTLDGGKCQPYFDVASYRPGMTLLNGAIVQIFNLADGLLANYTPIHYTPTNTSVKGHLEGIDNALISVDDFFGNVVYVSPDGNDSTGNGSVGNPYATISHAMLTITTASDTNPYVIRFSGRISETLGFTLKPYISIVGESQFGAYLDNLVALTLDTSFGTITNPSLVVYKDFQCNDITLDSTSFSNSVLSSFHFINFLATDLITNASVNNRFSIFFYSSDIFGSTTIQNSETWSFNTVFSSGLTLGGATYTNTDMSFQGNGNTINGLTATAPLALSFTPSFTINASKISGFVTLDGGKCNLLVDAISNNTSITPTLTNGALYTLGTETKSLKTSYSPTNYTPTSTTLDGTLAGIDAKLASVSVNGLIYLGDWNASTNTPTLTSSVGTEHSFYHVSVSGTTSINGNAVWNKNDWIYFTGGVWTRVAYSVYTDVSASTVSSLAAGTALNVGANLTTGALNLGSSNASNITNVNSPQTIMNTSARVSNNANHPYIAIGDDANFTGVVYGRAGVATAWFANALTGDGCLRQGITSRRLLLGVGTNVNNSNVVMTNAITNFLLPITLPTTSPAGGTASSLSYYEEATLTSNTTGAATLSNYTVYIRKINDQTFLHFTPFTIPSAGTGNLVFTTALATRFRPANLSQYVVQGGNGGGASPLVIEITTAGNITIYGDTALNVFTPALAAYLNGTCVEMKN